jgi:hypothetical protein
MIPASRHWLAAAGLGLLCLSASCNKVGDEEARAIVRSYIAKLAEAYRVSDAELLDPVATDAEVRRVTALVGIKRDSGLNLDSELLEVTFGKIERKKEEILVETQERWRYRDRQIGTGKVVGLPSEDFYSIRYSLLREKDKWRVDQISFITPPEIGRIAPPMTTDVRAAHGLLPREEEGKK